MTEYDVLEQFGLVPKPDELPTIRRLLAEETEQTRKHNGNVPLLRLFCIQLFAHGKVDDIFLIWRAKRSNFDAGCGIEVELLCGAGMDATKGYLSKQESQEAVEILKYLNEHQANSEVWSPQAHLKFWQNYYKLP